MTATRADDVREEGFERHGLVVVRADSLDLTQHRAELGRRVLAGRQDGLRNPQPAALDDRPALVVARHACVTGGAGSHTRTGQA